VRGQLLEGIASHLLRVQVSVQILSVRRDALLLHVRVVAEDSMSLHTLSLHCDYLVVHLRVMCKDFLVECSCR
jgi:hypothetical protein